MHYCLLNDNPKIIQLLIDKKINLNVLDSSGKSVLFYPIKYYYKDTLDVLLSNHTQIGLNVTDIKDNNDMYAVHYAIFFDNYYAFKKIINITNNINYQITKLNNYNSLHYAINKGNVQIIKLILTKIYDINMQTSDGKTALHISVENEDFEITKLLLINNINPNITENVQHFTALNYAIFMNNMKLCELLIKYDIDYSIQDLNGNISLFYALNNNIIYFDIILNKILNFDENKIKHILNIVNLNGYGIIKFLLQQKDDVVHTYLNKILKYIDLNVQDIKKNTIFYLLIKNNKWKQYIDIFVKKKINIYIICDNGKNIYENAKLIMNDEDFNMFNNLIVENIYNLLHKHPNKWKLKWHNECSIMNQKNEKECKEKIKKFIFIENGILKQKNHIDILIEKYDHVEFTTFIGTSFDIISGLIYIYEKYNDLVNIIDINNDKFDFFKKNEIFWSYYNLNIPNNLKVNILEIFKNPKRKKFIILPLGIHISKGMHFNLLFIDVHEYIIERFEPYGSLYPYQYNYNHKLLDHILVSFFTNIVKMLNADITIKYFEPSIYLPQIGFQHLENYNCNSNKYIGDPCGFCAPWAFWFADMKLKYNNANITSKTLIKQLLDYIKIYNISSKKMIRNFTQFMINIRDDLLKKVNLTINQFINEEYDSEQYISLINEITNRINKLK